MAKGRIEIDREKCKGCHLCIAFCPKECITVSPTINEKGYFPAEYSDNQDDPCCTGCTVCAVVCPDVAIEVYRG